MFLCVLGKLNARVRASWMYRAIDQALALNRTEVRPDGLRPEKMSVRFAINWRARDVHPCDRDLAGDRTARRLVEETFSETVAALDRLFIALPEVDVIDLKVLEGDIKKDGILLSGSILRRGFETWHPSSAAMRLKLLGVHYNLVNLCFEPLATSDSERSLSKSGTTAHQPYDSYRALTDPNRAEDASKRVWHQDKVGPY